MDLTSDSRKPQNEKLFHMAINFSSVESTTQECEMYLPDDIKDKRPGGMEDDLRSKMVDDLTHRCWIPCIRDPSLHIELQIWFIVLEGSRQKINSRESNVSQCWSRSMHNPLTCF